MHFMLGYRQKCEIVVTQIGVDLWEAKFTPTMVAHGNSVADALGNLILRHPYTFKIKILKSTHTLGIRP